MDSDNYDGYTAHLTNGLTRDADVLGLILLGTTADPAWRDEWSDHDFWIITRSETQRRYLDNASWLPRAEDILTSARHGTSYRTVLYRNRHKAEYAVFDHEEAKSGMIERFDVAIDRQDITSLARSIQEESRKRRSTQLESADALENFCLLMWSAWERTARGEMLSARHYLGAGIDSLLSLLVAHAGSEVSTADFLDPRRRLERTHPEWATEIERCCQLPMPQAAIAFLDLGRRLLEPTAPELAWGAVSSTREWLAEAEPPLAVG